MVDHVEADAVEVGHLAQLLGELQLVDAVPRGELLAAHQHVLVVVGRYQHARRHGQAQRRDAEHVGDELVALAVPGVEERARAHQALGLEGVVGIGVAGAVTRRVAQVVLHHPVGPQNAHVVDLARAVQPTSSGTPRAKMRR